MTAFARIKPVAAIVLLLALCPGPLPAQGGSDRPGADRPSPGAAVVVSSGGRRLTEAMLDEARRYGQILAAAEFSAADAAALRAALIASFLKQPAQQAAAYDSVGTMLRQRLPGGAPSWLDLALLRYAQWQSYGQAQRFADFSGTPLGRMVLKYNPVLVHSGGAIVTRDNVDCRFYADTMVARAAALAPPTAADKDRFARTLAAHFAAMPAQRKTYLTQAEIRLARLVLVYDGDGGTRAAVLADIRKEVHAPADVARAARQVENDASPADAATGGAQALDAEQRLAAMQLQLQTQLDAARAARSAALALRNGTAAVPREAVPRAAGPAAPGRYWRSFIEAAAAGSPGARAGGVGSLRDLIARKARAGQEQQK